LVEESECYISIESREEEMNDMQIQLQKALEKRNGGTTKSLPSSQPPTFKAIVNKGPGIKEYKMIYTMRIYPNGKVYCTSPTVIGQNTKYNSNKKTKAKVKTIAKTEIKQEELI